MNIRLTLLAVTSLTIVNFQYAGWSDTINSFWSGKNNQNTEKFEHIRLSQEIKNNQCSPEIQSLFSEDIRSGKMTNVNSGVLTANSLPDFFFKRGTDRLVGAKIMRDVIAQESLHLLYVPEKCICNHNNEMWVAAKKIEKVSDSSPLNLEQTKQISRLIDKTWVWDLWDRNLIHMKDGRIALIDTDLKGFTVNKSGRDLGLFWFKEKNKFYPDAQKYLEQQIEKDNIRLALHERFVEKLREEKEFNLLKVYEQSQIRDYEKMKK